MSKDKSSYQKNKKQASSDNYETPQYVVDYAAFLFLQLDTWSLTKPLAESPSGIRGGWNYFDLDVCAEASTTKAMDYYDEEINGLNQDWTQYENIWCNPPYSGQDAWLRKIVSTHRDPKSLGQTATFLIPPRTDTKRWQYTDSAKYIVFIEGRINFLLNGEPIKGNPAPSVLIHYVSGHTKGPTCLYWKRDEMIRWYEQQIAKVKP